MSEQKHTPEPWRVYVPDDYEGPTKIPGYGIESERGDAVVWAALEPETGLQRDADGPRIVACVNALAGIETAEIEAGVVADLIGKLERAHAYIDEAGLATTMDDSREECLEAIDALLARLGRQS